jgi:hypothetical protein
VKLLQAKLLKNGTLKALSRGYPARHADHPCADVINPDLLAFIKALRLRAVPDPDRGADGRDCVASGHLACYMTI